ncbi:hypothetical protein BH11PSE2_BH11PSE2_11590 [soil metagenome]
MKDIVISPLSQALRIENAPAAQGELVGRAQPSDVATHDQAQAPPTPVDEPAAIIAASRQQAAACQDGLGVLLAETAHLITDPRTPEPLRQAAVKLVALQTVIDPPPTAEVIKGALSQSGLFTEARLASALPVPPDLKTAILALRDIAQVLANGDMPPVERAGQNHPAKPPPPFRGADLHPQPAVPAVPASALPISPARLVRESDAALSRLELLQLASAPVPGQSSERASQPAVWLFEVPLATPQGSAVAQFEISRDGAGTAMEVARAWRVRFSIDVDPMGPVHAQIAMRGDRTSVTLWAERDESVQQLTASRGSLAAALSGAEVAVYPGAPHRPPPSAGRLVDQSS